MANRVKPDAYDWSQISRQAADRARSDKAACEVISLEAAAAKDEAKKLVSDVQTGLSAKVDRVPGKSLSANDFTDEAKAKVDALTAPDAFVDPKKLLVYYGYPVAFLGLWNADAVAAEIGVYDNWVCGHTYESPSHESYALTAAVISKVTAKGTKVWGYIPLGSSYGLSIAEITASIANWKSLGVEGIFIDEFGFDYGNSRQRQVDAVNAVHAAGLKYVANAWVVQEVMVDDAADLPSEWAADDWRRSQYTTGNPTNLALPRKVDDVYLIENYCASHTGLQTTWDFHERVDSVMKANAALSSPMRLWGLTVVKETASVVDGYKVPDASGYAPFQGFNEFAKYAYTSALIHQLNSWGIGGYSFGSSGQPVYYPKFSPALGMSTAGDYGWSNSSPYHIFRLFGDVVLKVYTAGTQGGMTAANTKYVVRSMPVLSGYADFLPEEKAKVGKLPADTGGALVLKVDKSESGLNKVKEGGKAGYRIYGKVSANYGDIGSCAIDLSESTTVSSVNGATGDNSVAVGLDVEASGNSSHAGGCKSSAYIDSSFARAKDDIGQKIEYYFSRSNLNTSSPTVVSSELLRTGFNAKVMVELIVCSSKISNGLCNTYTISGYAGGGIFTETNRVVDEQLNGTSNVSVRVNGNKLEVLVSFSFISAGNIFGTVRKLEVKNS